MFHYTDETFAKVQGDFIVTYNSGIFFSLANNRNKKLEGCRRDSLHEKVSKNVGNLLFSDV